MTLTSMTVPRSAPADAGQSALAPWLRRLAPFMLIPLGAIYCRIYETLFGEPPSTTWESLLWATATLSPWVVAVLLFERGVTAGQTRGRLVRRALFFGLIAYAASSFAALLLDVGAERAFYSRLPLLAVAVLAAALYPIPVAGGSGAGAPANENDPPLAPTEIVFASAAGNYVELHSGGRSIVWRQTMQNAERILGPAGFVRVHRSYLVPRRSIERVTRGRKGPVEVALRNGRRLPVSNRYAANLRD